jgi:hypothetical protein
LPPASIEFGSLAVLLIKHHRDEAEPGMCSLDSKVVDHGVENWAHADMICSSLLSIFLRNGIVELPDFEPWLIRKANGTRRAVPVGPASHAQGKPPRRTPGIHRAFDERPGQVVHQGLGWFLREAWKLEHQLVEDFLKNTSNIATA